MTKLHSACLALAVLLGAPAAARAADAYPAYPIHLVVPAPPGAGIDAAARIVAQKMGEVLNGSIIVDNKSGASGMIGSAQVAHSKPDGYTLLLSSSTSHSAAPHLYKELPYDAVKDFTSIGRISLYVYALFVRPDSGIASLAELADYARRKGSVTYGYGNSLAQIAGAMFVKNEHLNAVGVAYKGTPPALTDLSSGVLDFMFADWAGSRPFATGKLIKPIAALSQEKVESLPDVAPMDAAYAVNVNAWAGISGPAGMPKDIVDKLNAALNKTLEDPAVRQKLTDFGLQVAAQTPAEFEKFVRDQERLWGEKITEVGIKPE